MKFLAILLLLSATTQAEVYDYAEAHRLAIASERPLIVFVEQDGCAPCDVLWDTLQRMDAAGEFKDCVLARVNLTRDPQMTRILNVRSTPTLDGYHFYQGQWRKSARIVGPTTATKVRDLIKQFTHRTVVNVKRISEMVKPSSVPYGGRMYSHPVCNSPSCGMCWGPNGIGTLLNKPQLVSRDVSSTNLIPITFTGPTPEQIKLAGEQPTPEGAVRALLDLIGLKPGDVLYDIGCGDGRIVVAAALRGATAVGIEIDENQVERSRQAIHFAGVGNMVEIIHQDALNVDLSLVGLCTIYLPLDVTESVIERLPRGCRVFTYLHPIKGGIKRVSDGYVFYELVVR